MSFYDAKLTKFGTIGGSYGSDGSINYAKRSNSIIGFAMGYYDAQRSVAFKAFIDSYSLKTDFGVQTEVNSKKDYAKVKQGISTFVYTLNLQVPSHSYNESRANLAKFQELSRYIINKKHEDQCLGEGRVAYTYVLFSNMIQNGLMKMIPIRAKPGDKKRQATIPDSWGKIRKYGARCYLTEINFKPDMEMGFHESPNGNLYPKAYSMSLTLNLQPMFIDGTLKSNKFTRGEGGEFTRYSIASFSMDGKYDEWDTQRWPFGLKANSLLDSNLLDTDRFGSDKSEAYATRVGGMVGMADFNSDTKYTVFKAFAESFSYKKSVQVTEGDNTHSSVGRIVFGGALKAQTYNLSLQVPSVSLNEGKANLAKMGTLMRMAIKKTSESSDAPDSGAIQNEGGGILYFYLANLISRPHQPLQRMLTGKLIKTHGLAVIIKSVTMTVDVEMGYFEENGYLIPKVFKLDFDLELSGDEEEDPFTAGTVVPDSSRYLNKLDDSRFPFGVSYSKVNQKDKEKTECGDEVPDLVEPAAERGGESEQEVESSDPAHEAPIPESPTDGTSSGAGTSNPDGDIETDTGGDNEESNSDEETSPNPTGIEIEGYYEEDEEEPTGIS